MNIKITLPDGNVREFPQNVKGSDIASAISEGLARNALAIEVNGEVRDLARPITEDATVKILTWNDEKEKRPSGIRRRTCWPKPWKRFTLT